MEDESKPMGSTESVALSDELKRLRNIEAAAKNLVAQKGRHNTQIAYERLVIALSPPNAIAHRPVEAEGRNGSGGATGCASGGEE